MINKAEILKFHQFKARMVSILLYKPWIVSIYILPTKCDMMNCIYKCAHNQICGMKYVFYVFVWRRFEGPTTISPQTPWVR